MPLTLFAWAAALFVLAAVVTDWAWFFGHPRAKFFVDHFGRGGARLFYAVLGLALIVLGIVCRTRIQV